MGKNILEQQKRLELVDECLRKYERPMNIEEIKDYCNRRLKKSTSARQYRYDIDRIEETYNAKIHSEKINGKICYTYENKGFTITNNKVCNEVELYNLNKIRKSLSAFSGLDIDTSLNEVTDEIDKILGYSKDNKAVISFEKVDLVCQGKGNIDDTLNAIFKAIVQKQTLNIKYAIPSRGEREWIIFPQFLKQYNQRWYLIGTEHKQGEKIKNMALDRITAFEPNQNIPYQRSATDFAEYFEDMVGITLPEGAEPVDVKLRIKRNEYPYIESKPIHPSQDELFEEDDDYKYVSLHVYDNYELRSKLLAYGSSVTVMEPKSLRNKMRKEIAKSLKNYEE